MTTAPRSNEGLILLTSFPPANAPEQAGRRHHQHQAPDHFTRAGEEARGDDVDHQREHLLEGVQPRQRFVDHQPEHGQQGDAETGTEVAAIDRHENVDATATALGAPCVRVPMPSHLRM